ncbi:heme exporter protein CcmD [Shewanella sp. D64]|uniref:heme exporter protein CcmD n=1 Tax=unclassified Shewanella TaxID=196818 RepID=UPI0022BA51B0|nr:MULTISPECIES: heme exporter protein CcmD [unclassified Shewanella]MEC4728803.1 heme exporter protein CcmD [Shewanella sp. D64]MEC4740697.1 heme exporter protein CcmD [Shewanella sp. E94]WBJ95237.1 heme exporter protein CcmD [Shewanella sp. MTB7]
MQFDSLADFFNMGGYAFYVWLAYGVTFFSLGILIVSSLRQKRKVLTVIAKKMQREDRLKANRSN